MVDLAERPAVKWGILLAALCAGGMLVFWTIRHAVLRSSGLPAGDLTEVTLTCTNPQCPGRTRETAPPDAPADTQGPYKYSAMIRGDFCDWPMECPTCGRKTVYLEVPTFRGTLRVHKLSDPSVRCFDCDEVIPIDSFSNPAPVVCPKCGKRMGG